MARCDKKCKWASRKIRFGIIGTAVNIGIFLSEKEFFAVFSRANGQPLGIGMAPHRGQKLLTGWLQEETGKNLPLFS